MLIEECAPTEPWEVQMKALILAVSFIFILDASAAGQMTKKKKKESMWATDLRERLATPGTNIRTW